MLYYQSRGNNIPLWTFCYSAMQGADYEGIKCIPFETIEDVESIRKKPENIIVGSQEACTAYLLVNGYKVPESIDKNINFNNHPEIFGRQYRITKTTELKNIQLPFFVKPHGRIKAFTGFVVETERTLKEIDFYLDGYEGEVQIQNPINFVSEWRCYVLKGKIIGVCNYKGDATVMPSFEKIKPIVQNDSFGLGVSAYTVDIGVTDSNETFVVEFNDAWAIENYGLSPEDYFKFVKCRWIEILKTTTGIEKF